MPTLLHQERLNIIIDSLRRHHARTILDLGCGTGPLIIALAEDRVFEKIVGIDISSRALLQCSRKLKIMGLEESERINLLNASFTELNPDFEGFDAAILLETIEHIRPDELSKLERTVFGGFRPRIIVITTPNQDYNEILGVPANRYRHPDHEFEWSRKKFRNWCEGVSNRNGYRATFSDLGKDHPMLGAPSQMAKFVLS